MLNKKIWTSWNWLKCFFEFMMQAKILAEKVDDVIKDCKSVRYFAFVKITLENMLEVCGLDNMQLLCSTELWDLQGHGFR